MEDAEQIKKPARAGVMAAPLLALLWLAALLGCGGVLICAWKFVKFAWGL